MAAATSAASWIRTPWNTSNRSRSPRRIDTVSSTLGSSTYTGWKRRSSAASVSTCLRYSSRVVAPIMCSSPRASIGLSMLPASMLPSAAPAPTTVCSSSRNSRIRPSAAFTSASTALQALLELAAVLRAGHQQTHVEGEDGLVPQPLRDVAVGDPLGQALDDRGLADAGVADEHRVVLGLAGQDLDHPTDLGVAADHRVALPGTSGRDQVLPVLLQRLVGALRGGRRTRWLPRTAASWPRNASRVMPCRASTRPAGLRSAFGDHGHEQMLDGDVLVVEPPGLLLGLVEERGQPLGDERPGPAGRRRGGSTRGTRCSSASTSAVSRSTSVPVASSSRGTSPSGCWSSASSRCSESTSTWPDRVRGVCAAARPAGISGSAG